jgi:hypothetical protein
MQKEEKERNGSTEALKALTRARGVLLGQVDRAAH